MSEGRPPEQLSLLPSIAARLRGLFKRTRIQHGGLSRYGRYWTLLFAVSATLVFATALVALPAALVLRHQRDHASVQDPVQGIPQPVTPAHATRELTQPSAWVWTGSLMLSLVAGLAFGAFSARRAARPSVDLLDAFRGLAAGDYTIRLSQPAGVSGQSAELARAFDNTAERHEHLDRRLREVAYALRPPLERLDQAVDTLRSKKKLSSGVVDRIAVEAARLRSLAVDVHTLVHHDGGGAHETQEQCDIAALLKEVCDDARLEAQDRGVSVQLLKTSAHDDRGMVLACRGAREHLRRALETIVRNAVRFSPQAATVLVWSKAEGDRVIVEVLDNGPGAPPRIIAVLRGANPGASDGQHRLGDGLSIAHRTILAHGGLLEAINIGIGGLMMRIILPVSSAPVA